MKKKEVNSVVFYGLLTAIVILFILLINNNEKLEDYKQSNQNLLDQNLNLYYDTLLNIEEKLKWGNKEVLQQSLVQDVRTLFSVQEDIEAI